VQEERAQALFGRLFRSFPAFSVYQIDFYMFLIMSICFAIYLAVSFSYAVRSPINMGRWSDAPERQDVIISFKDERSRPLDASGRFFTNKQDFGQAAPAPSSASRRLSPSGLLAMVLAASAIGFSSGRPVEIL
jgi:hypothetical protein